jgi:hypothetical protein
LGIHLVSCLPCVAMRRLCAALRGSARLCAALRGSARLCAALRGSARLCAALRGSARLCAALRGSARLCAAPLGRYSCLSPDRPSCLRIHLVSCLPFPALRGSAAALRGSAGLCGGSAADLRRLCGGSAAALLSALRRLFCRLSAKRWSDFGKNDKLVFIFGCHF